MISGRVGEATEAHPLTGQLLTKKQLPHPAEKSPSIHLGSQFPSESFSLSVLSIRKYCADQTRLPQIFIALSRRVRVRRKEPQKGQTEGEYEILTHPYT